MNETLSAAGSAAKFCTRSPARNENTGIHARNRPAPRGVQPNFARACSQRRCWHLRKESACAAGSAAKFCTRPPVTKMLAFTYGTGPRRGECSQISHAPARNEDAGIRARKRPAPWGMQPNFARARPRVIKKLCLLTKRQSLALRYHSCCSACAEPLETR